MSFGAPSEHIVDDRTVLATGLARAALSDPHSIHPSVWDELRAHFSEKEILELCYCIGHYAGAQLFTVLLKPDLEGDQ